MTIEDLDSLPFIDRDLTKWKLYAYHNGNYKRTPGTYIMSGRDCWWHKCTFCVEQNNKYEVRSVSDVSDEIIECRKMGFREIFDDSGTFPADIWLEHFCWHWESEKMIYEFLIYPIDHLLLVLQ